MTVGVTPEFFAAIGEELARHGSATFERQLRHKDGTFLEVEIAGAPLSGDRRVGIVRDISRRKAAERALRASEEKFARAFAANPAGIVISRLADGCFLDANPAYLQMLGYTRDELIGRRSIELGIISPEERARVVDRAAQPPNRAPFEVQVRTKSGSTVEIMTAFAMIDVVGESCLLTMAVDITERKRYEKLLLDTNAVLEQRVAERTADLQRAVDDLQRANRLKDEFMAMISHELRTPLTGVLSLSEMLGDQVAGPLNERQSAYVQGITNSGNRLLYVINGILSYTHLISGKLPLQVEPCELANLLNICAVSQQHNAVAKGLTIAIGVDPPGLTVTSDASALAGILKRLLDNAVKFTPEGGQIGLTAQMGAVPATVDLIVWDTGIGIAAGQIEHILKPFVQADGSLARPYEGIGMGLAYVHEMAHRLGGTLAVESTPSGGSRFTITLPA
jgi:PAS domain S-box-containing protein